MNHWKIQLTPTGSYSKVIKNGKDISNDIDAIRITTEVNGVTRVVVRYINATVDLEAEEIEE